MKLTTAETKKYALLAGKTTAGGMTPAERMAYDALVVKMAKPEPRKKAAAKKKVTKS